MIIGLTGYAQTGKDTGAGFLIQEGFERKAFADKLRESLYRLNPPVALEEVDDQCNAGTFFVRVQQIVDRLGWDVAKVTYLEIRELLQRFGTEVGRDLYGTNFWVDIVMNSLNPDTNYVITDVRFPNEADAVKAAGGVVVRILRPGVEAVNGHSSDTSVDLITPDYYVFNDGTMEHFRGQILHIMDIESK